MRFVGSDRLYSSSVAILDFTWKFRYNWTWVQQQLLRYDKTGNKKRATCFATLLNELNGDVARFTTHEKKKTPSKLICCKTGSKVGGKTRHSLAAMPVFCCLFYYSLTKRNVILTLFCFFWRFLRLDSSHQALLLSLHLKSDITNTSKGYLFESKISW